MSRDYDTITMDRTSLRQMVENAIAAERDRCVNLAVDEYSEQAKLATYHKGEGDFEAMDRRNAAAVAATKIAAAIRNEPNT